MRVPVVLSVMLLGFAMLAVRVGAAQPDSSEVSQYKLEPTSSFETGCFGPCECPIFTQPLRGTFTLQRVGFDPLFTNYKVSNVQWIVSAATSDLTIRGSGTYRVGGEFAVQQQLSLDLSVGGKDLQHFDSGLVLGGGEFPRIDIDISLHQNSACIDTVIHVEAVDPVVTSAEPSDLSSEFSVRVAPNPFRGKTDVRLTLDRAGDLDVTIYDVRGRAVRHLMSGTWVSAGARTFSWDGRRDQGSTCAAGIYFLGARIGSEHMTRRIVKVE